MSNIPHQADRYKHLWITNSCQKMQDMAFVPVSSFVLKTGIASAPLKTCNARCIQFAPSVYMASSDAKSSPKSRRFKPGKGAPVQKTKLEPETVFIETGPSQLELIVPTLAILTVVGIIPFVAAVSRAAWVRYKFTSRRISISSGFQGKDQVEIIYRDIEMVKYVKRLGGAADMVLTLRDGAKVEIRSVPQFEKIYDYVMQQVSEEARESSGAA